MANSATLGDPLPIRYRAGSILGGVYPVTIVMDTTGVDLTIFDPGADRFCALVGIQYAEADAHNLTIKSGTTVLTTYQMPVNGGLSIPIGAPILSTLAKNSVLAFNTSVAIATILAYVIEYEQLTIW